MIRNLPAKWDLEVDVVSVGSGIGGLAAAITAHDHGARAAVTRVAMSASLNWIASNSLSGLPN